MFDIFRLRVDVFVVEQQCAYPEVEPSDCDVETRHLTGYDDAGSLIAYARLLPPRPDSSNARLGRVVVRQEVRRRGIGHQLVRRALNEIQHCWGNVPIEISAQEYLGKFYQGYGFVRVSDVYLDHGVPHVDMLKNV
ncbi:MAG: GNAT family N-acetyltransferase [Nitrospirales bacterium]|nr:GNAT family N-acetyltransferase [Nitrospira sp.]MDR4501989.1 GNAT family N-acetyltransferase [Nitrospirales bacterium]